LAPQLCNVVTTLEEAVAIIRAVGSPAVQTIFDTHNTAAEARPLPALLREYFPWIRHVHLNEMDGRRPGADNFPFALVMRTLRELGYRGWLSVEVFDFKPDGETAARQAVEYLRSVAAQAIRGRGRQALPEATSRTCPRSKPDLSRETRPAKRRLTGLHGQFAFSAPTDGPRTHVRRM
jgi:hypothetical protein